MDEEILLDLSRPSESYLAFLNLHDSQQSPPATYRELFQVADPSRLRFWKSPSEALGATLEAHFQNISRDARYFYYVGPGNPEMENEIHEKFSGIHIRALGSDPEEMVAERAKPGSFLLLYSVHPLDSSFWSRELMASVAKHFLADSQSYVLVDESLASLFWDGAEDVGSLRNFPEPRLGTLLSLQSWTAPPQGLTLVNNVPAESLRDWNDSDDSLKSWSPLLQLWTREFHRGAQHLRLRTALSRNARTLLEELRPLIRSEQLLCAHWPKAGHSVFLKAPRVSLTDFQQKMREMKIEFPARAAGSGVEFRITIPLSGKKVREAARRLVQILQ
jgi:hypothetical protein